MRKKIILISIITVAAFVAMVPVATANGFICGDANNDNEVNVSDAVYIINYVFVEGPAPVPLCVGDVNNDTSINVSDAVYIINYVFVGGPEPITDCCPICPSTVTDIDGNVYQTVLIGDQCWMMENLKVTHYRNGDPIEYVTDGGTWSGLSTGAYCEYADNPSNVDTYGMLYNWYAVDTSANIAPEGWHVPTDAEWKQLEMYLGMSQEDADAEGWRGTDEGGKLKEAGTSHWYAPNTGATNESGFTALPAGGRNADGTFSSGESQATAYFWAVDIDSHGNWALCRHLMYNRADVFRDGNHMRSGYSVRCIKD